MIKKFENYEDISFDNLKDKIFEYVMDELNLKEGTIIDVDYVDSELKIYTNEQLGYLTKYKIKAEYIGSDF